MIEHTLTETAKIVRKLLKETFGAHRFSVRCETGSMMTAINIEWVDGPSQSAVEDLTEQFVSGSFNGMNDTYEYKKERTVRYGVKYISCRRDMSAQTLCLIQRHISKLSGATVWPQDGHQSCPVQLIDGELVQAVDGFNTWYATARQYFETMQLVSKKQKQTVGKF